MNSNGIIFGYAFNKYEARNPKFETMLNDQISNVRDKQEFMKFEF